MKSLLSSTPVLWFLFLFNLVVAVAAAFGLHGTQQIMTSAGMGVVALGAGAGLVQRDSGLTHANSSNRKLRVPMPDSKEAP